MSLGLHGQLAIQPSALWGGVYVGIGLLAQQVGGAVFGDASGTATTLVFGVPGLAIGWFSLGMAFSLPMWLGAIYLYWYALGRPLTHADAKP